MRGVDAGSRAVSEALPGKHERKGNATGYRGVYVSRNKERFEARLSVDGKDKNFGTYGSVEDAARAYDM